MNLHSMGMIGYGEVGKIFASGLLSLMATATAEIYTPLLRSAVPA